MNKVVNRVSESLSNKFYSALDEGLYTRERSREFLEFTDEKEVSAIKGFDWIIDFDEVKDYSKEDFDRLINNTNDEIKVVAKEWDKLDKQDKGFNNEFAKRYDLLQHKLSDIEEVMDVIKGEIEITFPNNTNNKGSK